MIEEVIDPIIPIIPIDLIITAVIQVMKKMSHPMMMKKKKKVTMMSLYQQLAKDFMEDQISNIFQTKNHLSQAFFQ